VREALTSDPDYDPARMSRPFKVLLILSATTAVAALAAACGTEKITVPPKDAQLHRGAQLFSQRCSGCHTLSYAATHGSAGNIRTAEITNGPNFDQRCERPVDRVLYAIENGGFSGAIMPQNVVVGEDARDVAMFVATYAGRQAAKAPGVTPCESQSVGSLPSPTSSSSSTTSTSTTSTSSSSTTTTSTKSNSKKSSGKKSKKNKKK
jgi:mono/diheme cytochrome c family protein